MIIKAFLEKLFYSIQKKASFFKNNYSKNQKEDDVVVVATPSTVNNKKLPIKTLKKLIPIRDFSEGVLQKIEQITLDYPAESLIFILGQPINKIYYLLEGTIEFTLQNKESYRIDSSSFLATLPINNGNICNTTAVTKSDCVILAIPDTVYYWWLNDSKRKIFNTTVNFIDFSLPKKLPATPFFKNFLEAWQTNRLRLPTLPQIAIQLRNAMKEEIGISDAVKIIELDSTTGTKLIQLANSPLYASLLPPKNLHDAVFHLGLDATCQLVTTVNMKQLFKTKFPQLLQMMNQLWKKSVHISSLSYVIAQESGVVNPEDALLAGLICDIGEIPIINFAEQYRDFNLDINELQNVMPYLSPSVGSYVLRELNFSQEFIDVPKQAENWFYESGKEELTLVDIVILAKFHSYLGTPKEKELPCLVLIPAYNKLKNPKLTPDISLDFVSQAKQRINMAMNVLK